MSVDRAETRPVNTGRWKMAVLVVPGSVTIKVFQPPQVKPPQAPFEGTPLTGRPPGRILGGFICQGIGLGGSVTLNGDPDDIAACTLGFIQMQWVETCWAYYRGKTNTEGSLLIQAARPPARKQTVCRDCLHPEQSRIWVNVADNGKASDSTTPPVTIGAVMDDEPHQTFMLGELNIKTGKTNLLHEAQVERHFCSILTLQDHEGQFHHLASRYWNVRWQATFQASDFDQPFTKEWHKRAISGGTGAAVGPTILGRPSDHRFAHVITTQMTPVCKELLKYQNDVIDNFLDSGTPNPKFNPGTRRESPVWSNFDVRR